MTIDGVLVQSLVPPTALVEEALENAIETQVEGAQLPIEEKLKKLVKLQSMAYAVGRDRDRNARKPWGFTKQVGKQEADQ